LRLREKKEKVLEEHRDKIFNSYSPIIPQGKEWRAKTTPQAKAIKPPEEAVKPADQRSDRVHQRRHSVSLLQSPWLVIISFCRYLLQMTTNNLFITVLL
jgi:hypothetical protein